MFGWLKKKGQDSRIYMCIKEVKWELESGDAVVRAKILAIASVLGKDLFADVEIPIDVVDRPLDYSREDLMRFYEVLEDIRNSATVQMEHLKKSMARFGVNFPPFAESHVKLSNRALEVWMATVGAGIVTERRGDVREIWRLLVQSRPHLDMAINAIVEVEKKTMEITGQQGGMFSAYDRTEWKKACNFVPSQFSKTLNLK